MNCVVCLHSHVCIIYLHRNSDRETAECMEEIFWFPNLSQVRLYVIKSYCIWNRSMPMIFIPSLNATAAFNHIRIYLLSSWFGHTKRCERKVRIHCSTGSCFCCSFNILVWLIRFSSWIYTHSYLRFAASAFVMGVAHRKNAHKRMTDATTVANIIYHTKSIHL